MPFIQTTDYSVQDGGTVVQIQPDGRLLWLTPDMGVILERSVEQAPVRRDTITLTGAAWPNDRPLSAEEIDQAKTEIAAAYEIWKTDVTFR
ncbi:hypothetical protein CKO28_00295 [Rhodovibrio sodomensis]|uniref:DUF4376 domain-containing protein n=1 Tax=Rhodovibrio sodomensis TaxID=1088 RepID=A0ABS1D8B5_9PROT|nr:hypothetical protein [Rhodovibrio sodomensis]MBK1666479.1 hypothetical protein [Rhodovibrio sodomensis]